LVKGFAEVNSFGYKIFRGFTVSSLIIKAIIVDRVPRYVQGRFFFGGNCLLPDVIFVLFGIAADEYVLCVTKVS
jgi:hypothetical protein